MNKNIECKIRQAELEYVLLGAWDRHQRGNGLSFQEFLEYETEQDRARYWSDEANELLEIYTGD